MVCFPLMTSETLFWFAALTGSLFFLIKIAMLLFGVCSHALHLDHFGSHHDVHLDHDADSSFKSFSLLSFLGFMMMFGWVGLAAHLQYHFTLMHSIAIACIAGIITSIFCTTLIQKLSRLANPGTVFCISDSVGKQAQVYQMIPPRGVGRIHVVVDDITREIDAISDVDHAIPSFSQVVVSKVICSQTVLVKQITQ